MKIIYQDNPLAATVVLTADEQREFWLKIKISEMENILESVWLESNKTYYDIDKIRKDVDIDYWSSDDDTKTKLDKRVDELFDIYMSDLNGIHVGDCTCVPCSCTKCHAEDVLGINTIQGLKKHSASIIEYAFLDFKTIDQVIHFLDNYVPDRSKGGWDTETDERWNAISPTFIEQASEAANWLKKYKKENLLWFL
jgi:hypothetical protein